VEEEVDVKVLLKFAYKYTCRE